MEDTGDTGLGTDPARAGKRKHEGGEPLWFPPDPPGVWQTTRTAIGELFKVCTKNPGCPNGLQPIAAFAPNESLRNCRKRPAFLAAVAAYETALRDGDVDRMAARRVLVEKHMTKQCRHCNDLHIKTQMEGPNNKKAAMRRMLEDARSNWFDHCRDCDATRAIEGDHLPGTKPKGMKRAFSPAELVKFFKTVEEAELHLRDCCENRCRMCHAAESTSDSGNRYNEPSSRHRARMAYRQLKMRYVDAIKGGIGKCQNPNCEFDGPTDGLVLEGYEMCFDFNHLDMTTKAVDAKTGKPRGIAVMVHDTKRMPEHVWKAEIDADIAKCRLECKNCHHEETWGK